jgi:hypothetical protein
MGRSLALLLGGLAAFALSGCHQNGSLQVSWAFVDGAGTQSAADGCGQHGVDSVLVTSVDTGSDSDQVQAICTLGVVTRPVPAGTWSVLVQALDPQGTLIQAAAGVDPKTNQSQAAIVLSQQTTTGLVVVDDAPPVPYAATFTPLPACMDGVDNDGDGRIDLDDSDCAGDPYGAHE